MKLHLLWILPAGAFVIWLAEPRTLQTRSSQVVLSEHARLSDAAPGKTEAEPAVAAKSKPAAPTEAIVPASGEWHGLSARVKNLSSDDQRGLDALYADSSRLIRTHEKEVDAYFAQSMSEIVGGTLEQSFFAVSSWIRYSTIPTAVLDHLWDYAPPADPVTDSANGHHHAAYTQGFRYDAIQAYALGELRKRFAQDGINLSSSEREALVKSLVAKASGEKSINQSLELFETLMALGEKKAVLDALATRSEDDRKLIADTMGLGQDS